MMMQGESRNGKEINWQEFQTKLLESDQVARLVVVNNKFARVIMKRPGAGGFENAPRASGIGAGGDPNVQAGGLGSMGTPNMGGIPGMAPGSGGGDPNSSQSQWYEDKSDKFNNQAGSMDGVDMQGGQRGGVSGPRLGAPPGPGPAILILLRHWLRGELRA